MTRFETSFVPDGELIIVKAFVTGPLRTANSRLVLDTGAAMTTLTHEFVEGLGYSPRDGIRRARVRTAISTEEGYFLPVAKFDALGFPMPSFVVQVFDLGHSDIDGLVGMNFLNLLNYEIRSAERRILAEQIGDGLV